MDSLEGCSIEQDTGGYSLDMESLRTMVKVGCAQLVLLFSIGASVCATPSAQDAPEIDEAYARFTSGDYKEAVRLSDKALASSPRSVRAQTVASLSYDGLGNFRLAKTFALKAIELDPNFELAYRALSRAYLHLGAYNKSMEAAQRSKALKPTSDAYMLTSLALMNLGKQKEAVAQARLGVKTDDIAATRWQLVNVVVDVETPRVAVTETKEALRRCRSINEFCEPVALRVIDATYRKALRPSATVEDKRLVKELETSLPKSPAMSRLFREYYSRSNDLVNAKKHADLVVVMDPKNADSYRIRSIINTRLQRYREAIADLNKLLALEPGDRDALYKRAVCYFELGETANATKSARAVVKEEPHAVDVWIFLCNALDSAGRRDEALETITDAISKNPGNPECFYTRARLARRLGQLERARRDLNKTVAFGMRTNEIYLARASVALELHLIDSALEDYSRIESSLANRRLRPKELLELSDAHEGKAKCYIANSDFVSAAKELTTAIEINPLERRFLLRANAYEKLGNARLAAQDRLTGKKFKQKQIKGSHPSKSSK